MSRKLVTPTVPDFDSRMKVIRAIILNAASKNLRSIEKLFSYVPIVDLAAIELSKVESVCPETETCVFVTVDGHLFFVVFFDQDQTVIQVDQYIHQELEVFFKEVLKKAGATLYLKPIKEASDPLSERLLPDLPIKFSNEVKSCGQLYGSSVEVIDSSRPFFHDTPYNKTIKVVWDHHSTSEQIERYLSFIFGYKDQPIASKVSLIGFRNDCTITCVLDKDTNASDSDLVRNILDYLFNDDDTPIEDLDESLCRIVVTESSGDYYNQFGLCNNGLNRYLLNNLNPNEAKFIQESL